MKHKLNKPRLPRKPTAPKEPVKPQKYIDPFPIYISMDDIFEDNVYHLHNDLKKIFDVDGTNGVPLEGIEDKLLRYVKGYLSLDNGHVSVHGTNLVDKLSIKDISIGYTIGYNSYDTDLRIVIFGDNLIEHIDLEVDSSYDYLMKRYNTKYRTYQYELNEYADKLKHYDEDMRIYEIELKKYNDNICKIDEFMKSIV
jgi:hypothetical protein